MAVTGSERAAAPALGPLRYAAVLAPAFDAACAAYESALGLARVSAGTIETALANDWRSPELAGRRYAGYAGDSDDPPWLVLVEASDARFVEPLAHHGWMALEIGVGDVDALARRIAPPFNVIGAPANLEVSDKIRAMQVVGPSGEVLYLTRVSEPVPPFELPLTKQPIGRLFIAVLSTPDRDATLAELEPIASVSGLRFETRVTVLNRRLGRAHAQRYKVATLQLAGRCLFEIDEVDAHGARPSGLVAGIHLIAAQGGGGPTVLHQGIAGESLLVLGVG